MEAVYKSGIIFRFRRPSSVPRRQPSEAMREALRQLAESEEMTPVITAARAERRNVVIEVFHGSDGRPLLIHTAAAPRSRVQGRTNAGTGPTRTL